VADGVAAARAAVDGLLANRVLRRRSADVSAESSLRGAWASAVLAGERITLAEVRSGAAAHNPIVQGALRAQAAIPVLAETWAHAPRQVLARLHALAAADLVHESLLGRPVRGAQRLDILSSVLKTTSSPAVVLAAVVHGELLSLDAFAPSSGVVARGAARLTLIDRGLDPKSLVVLEAGHRELAGEYASALDAYRSGTPAGVAEWLRHCAAAVEVGAREAVAICVAILRS
jgi:hypothetical protein